MKPMSNDELIDAEEHLFGREYMDGVSRDEARVAAFGEVFTPRELVDKLLDHVDPVIFTDARKSCLDPTCGDGQFLAGVLLRRLQNNIPLDEALFTIYGCDIHEDNVVVCRRRLLCGIDNPELTILLEKNIVIDDALSKYGRSPRLI